MPTSNGLPPRELSLEKFPVKCEVKVGILLLEACLDKNIKKQFSQPTLSKLVRYINSESKTNRSIDLYLFDLKILMLPCR